MIKDHYVAGFVFDKELEHIYLIRKNRPSWQENMLNGIGGHIESNESPVSAVVREFIEEASVKINSEDWHHIATLSSKPDKESGFPWECWFFMAVTDQVPVTNTDEEVVKIKLTELVNGDVIPNLNWLIPLALHGEKSWPVIAHE